MSWGLVLVKMIFSKEKLPDERAKEAKKLVKNIKTLDVGGGNGWLTSYLVDPKKVTIVDLNKNALKENPAKDKIFRDIRNLPKKLSGKFEQATLFEVIEHLKTKGDRTKVLRGIYRCLKKNGRFVMSTPNKDRLSSLMRKIIFKPRTYPYEVAEMEGVAHTDYHYFEYNKQELQEELSKIGFKKIKIYSKFIQVPIFQFCFNVYSKLGLVLYAVAEK